MSPRKTYWIKAHTKSLGPTFRLQLQLQYRDSRGQHYPNLAIGEAGPQWSSIEGAIRLETEGALKELLLIIRSLQNSDGNAATSFLVDEVSIIEMEPGVEMIKNGSFDHSFTGWKRATAAAATLAVVEDGFNGRNAIQVSGRESCDAGICQHVEVEVGDYFYCQAYFKAIDIDHWFRINIKENTTDGDPSYFRPSGGPVTVSQWHRIAGGYHAQCSSSVDLWIVSDDMNSGDFLVDSISMVPLKPVRTIELQ